MMSVIPSLSFCWVFNCMYAIGDHCVMWGCIVWLRFWRTWWRGTFTAVFPLSFCWVFVYYRRSLRGVEFHCAVEVEKTWWRGTFNAVRDPLIVILLSVCILSEIVVWCAVSLCGLVGRAYWCGTFNIISGSCHKYHFVYYWQLCLSRQAYFCRDKTCLLSRQKYACCDKNVFVAKKGRQFFCLHKNMFVATKVSRQKTCFVARKTCLWRQRRVCRDDSSRQK